mmetsp:Transcript_9631/g.18879  ORF Transcript_9631/g.18879 Transcript_9631/m.18879 type:complete len:268 (+) Transcript_9631:1852-2655(+)
MSTRRGRPALLPTSRASSTQASNRSPQPTATRRRSPPSSLKLTSPPLLLQPTTCRLPTQLPHPHPISIRTRALKPRHLPQQLSPSRLPQPILSPTSPADHGEPKASTLGGQQTLPPLRRQRLPRILPPPLRQLLRLLPRQHHRSKRRLLRNRRRANKYGHPGEARRERQRQRQSWVRSRSSPTRCSWGLVVRRPRRRREQPSDTRKTARPKHEHRPSLRLPLPLPLPQPQPRLQPPDPRLCSSTWTTTRLQRQGTTPAVLPAAASTS